jgi:hypothetical protein
VKAVKAVRVGGGDGLSGDRSEPAVELASDVDRDCMPVVTSAM